MIFDFPFTDSAEAKKRPALVAANTKGDNLILCRITSRFRPDPYLIDLPENAFQAGNLQLHSYIMPEVLFTIHKSLISYKVGKVTDSKVKQVQNKLIEIFSA